MNFIEQLTFRILRQRGILKGNYSADVNLRYWKKDQICYRFEDSIINIPEYKDGMYEVANQYKSLLSTYGITLVQVTHLELADINIRVHEKNIYTPSGKETKGVCHAPYYDEDKHNIVKAYIELTPNRHLLRDTEDVIDTGLHEFGHATFCDNHSTWGYDVMGNSKRVLKFTDRDLQTFDMAMQLRRSNI
jgi:predicted Zn-dependent protease